MEGKEVVFVYVSRFGEHSYDLLPVTLHSTQLEILLFDFACVSLAMIKHLALLTIPNNFPANENVLQ